MNSGAGATNSRATSQSNREIIRSFATFFESWTASQNHHLSELLSAADSPNSSDLEDVIGRVLAHYQQYYDEKSRVAAANVFLLFGPPWLTRIERALLWVTGFKPGLAVQLAASAVGDLSDDQRREMERVRVRTRMEEKALNDEMAKIQENLAAPSLMEVARRRVRPLRDGEVDEEQEAVESVKAALEEAVAAADLLRLRTAMAVVEALTPVQAVKFLAAAARLQLQLHSCGSHRDGDR